MFSGQSICLLNDSFPPQVDGVANAVLNYAKEIEKNGAKAMVVTPMHPDADDGKYPYTISRYPSVNFKRTEAYKMGIPFSPEVAKKVTENGVNILHSHCPIISTVMARELRQIVNAPVILTYHTKFDIDIDNVFKNKTLQNTAKKAMAANISACDEVWVVSKGAGENLTSLGYEGDYIVMPNGVAVAKERLDDGKVHALTADYDLPSGIPVYLYVGRVMWYKGLKITIDALAMLKNRNKDFRMVFVGGGDDLSSVKKYAEDCGIGDKCIFTGAIRNEELLRAWYCRGDLFLFPSTYDTNGLVVREAAACSLASVLINGSCAAEDAKDGRNSFFIDENAESMYECLLALYNKTDMVKQVGINAGNELYMSWADSVKIAMERYETVIDRHRSGYYPKRAKKPMETFMKMNGELMEVLMGILPEKKK